MFKLTVIIISLFQIQALADFSLESAKAFAYKRPFILNTVILESLTFKCNKYLNYDEDLSRVNYFFTKCLYATKTLINLLNVESFEVKKNYFLPVSFSKTLLKMAKDKSVITFLDHFNKNIHTLKIRELKKYITILFKDKYSFDEFVAVLFQDQTLSHLLYLEGKIDQESLRVLKISNNKFFECFAADKSEIMEFFGYPSVEGNIYHFYVIRYLSKKLETHFGYETAAFISFMFNYSYELFELENKISSIFSDPRCINDESSINDIKLGFLGAYYKDDFSKNIQMLNYKIKNSMDYFIYENSKKIKDKVFIN